MSIKHVFFSLGLLLTFLTESFFAWNIGGIRAPFMLCLIFLWFLHLSAGPRVIFAVIFGIMADAVSVFPFGTHLISFLATSFFVEFLHMTFSNIKVPLTQGVALGAMLTLFYGISIISDFFLSSSEISILRWPLQSIASLLSGILSWSILVPAIFGGFSILARKLFFRTY